MEINFQKDLNVFVGENDTGNESCWIRGSGVLKDTPKKLWQKTKDFSGISHGKYMEYFSKREFAYAYQLGEVTMFKEPKSLSDYGITTAPQSFAYVDG